MNDKVKEKELLKQITINGQYVKDLSFESPRAPKSLVGKQDRPAIDIAIDVKAAALNEESFEVVLHITADAKQGEEPMFLCELAYAGVFSLSNVPEEEREPALLIFCPNLLFPFARRVIADVTRDGGFPPLMLDPIDFARLFAQRKQASEEAKESTKQ